MLSRYQVVIQSLAAVTSTGVSRDIVTGGGLRNRQPITLSSRFENLTIDKINNIARYNLIDTKYHQMAF